MWSMESAGTETGRMALLNAGWEPFAVTSNVTKSTERNDCGGQRIITVYYFRKEIKEDETTEENIINIQAEMPCDLEG
jgi:hypothetical protein